MYMRDDQSWDGPSLREETRTLQGHAFELLGSVVAFSIFLGLSINLAASWLFQYNRQQVLFIMGICGAVVLLTIIVFIFHILTTIKEFHLDIEIPLPLLVSKQG